MGESALPWNTSVSEDDELHLGEEHEDDAGDHEDDKQGTKHSWVDELEDQDEDEDEIGFEEG